MIIQKDTINTAIELIKSGNLYRGENYLDIAKKFLELKEKVLNTKNDKVKENFIWIYVATTKDAYSHIRGGMLGILLTGIQDGRSLENVTSEFNEKMNPATYRRSQSDPSLGNRQQAEKIVEQLGLEDSLRRRFAKLEEIPEEELIWKNNFKEKEVKEEKKGIFSNVKTKERPTIKKSKDVIPSSTMTWVKFCRTVLPDADNIEALVDDPRRFIALVTEAVKDSERLFIWDNPFSWYYTNGIDCDMKQRVESQGGRYENNKIRCSLSWEGGTDLDIHCIEPNNNHIYYSKKESSYSDGYLDIDANGGGITSLKPVENIRFANRPMQGHYVFYVHNYCEREDGYTPYTVELEVEGKVFVYQGIAGPTGYQQTVFEFDYIEGQVPNIEGNSLWNVNNDFIKVNAIVPSPNTWNKNSNVSNGEHIFFILDGVKDETEGRGRGFFTETLKSDLQEVRKTLEAYTQITPIEGEEDASACGIGFIKDRDWNLTLRVTSNNTIKLIKIDRFD